MKKVLVIGYVWPEPNSSAAGSHILSIMKLFKEQNYSVEFSTPCAVSEHSVDLESFGITSCSIELNSDSFDLYIKELNPDIVLFDRFMMEEQFSWRVAKNSPKALRVLDTEDLQCLRNARHQALKQDRQMSKSDLFGDLAKREIASILRSDLSLIISTYEMKLLTETFKVDEKLLHHLPFMVDFESLEKDTKSFEDRVDFVSIGSFRHAPNWDAVLYLQKIWPLIRKELPQANLNIYGSYPPAKAMALNNPKTGFLVKGWAKSADEVMQNSRLCLAPIRFGAGIKGKLLDAMKNQTPSITTSVGSEGMADDMLWSGAIANEIEEFVKQAVSLYKDEVKWREAQKNSYKILEAKYDKTILGKSLISKIEELEGSLEEHRLDNFTGSMLLHHSMASTKYMSQWIAEKNRTL